MWTQTSVWARRTLKLGPVHPGLGSPPNLVALTDSFEHDLFSRSLNAPGCLITPQTSSVGSQLKRSSSVKLEIPTVL